jgi:hypothetical protein
MINLVGNDHPNLAFAMAAACAVLLLPIVLFPIAKILRRMGLSGWWCLLYLTGIGIIVGIWVLAYCRWPALDRTENSN